MTPTTTVAFLITKTAAFRIGSALHGFRHTRFKSAAMPPTISEHILSFL
jgi:hypothetical protein